MELLRSWQLVARTLSFHKGAYVTYARHAFHVLHLQGDATDAKWMAPTGSMGCAKTPSANIAVLLLKTMFPAIHHPASIIQHPASTIQH